jgi:hypothetical protein
MLVSGPLGPDPVHDRTVREETRWQQERSTGTATLGRIAAAVRSSGS